MSYEKAEAAAKYIKSRLDIHPKLLIILGSGLGKFADTLSDKVTINYSEIPHLPRTTVEGHAGKLVVGHCGSAAVAVMAGRFHYYEGYSLEEVVLPVRIAFLAGIQKMIITNAAGALNREFEPGDLMLIEDHVNLLGANPLRGPNDKRFGPRFPDMTEAYDQQMRSIALSKAEALGIRLRRGIYIAIPGPSYETPAEIRFLSNFGDAVGMSTVPEVIAARHCGIRVLGLSCISNMAAGINGGLLDHQDVVEVGESVSNKFIQLLSAIIPEL
ncbi:MAG: purine-nucleoside phosphorylase [Acidobacteriota bacterium]|nr:purine-nucleoside phosphorylase [Blastocatellia bacterium]MDW8412420.1 purine-nucleoside phosphorylase [Acidobacteriota bacterium]